MERANIRILGTVEVAFGPSTVVARGRMQRLLLAELAVAAGSVVVRDALIGSMWGDDPPDGAEHSLQQHVSSLRKLIGSTGHPSPATVLVGRGPGYALDNAVVDADEFETHAKAGFRSASEHQWATAADEFDRALGLWRGEPFEDDALSERVMAAATRLRSVRRSVVERRFDALLALGSPSALVPDLEVAVRDHPYDEAFRRQLMLALYRSGRQADALQVFRAMRALLIDELGVEPSAETRRLEQDILEQRAELDQIPSESVDLFSTIADEGIGMLPSLELADGQRIFLTGAVCVVGRDPDAAIRLVDRRVSRRHAVFERSGSRWSVRDMGSTNGTHVAGERVDEADVVDGDEISFGGLMVRFRSG